MTEPRLAASAPAAISPPPFKHVVLTRFNVRYVEDPNARSIGVDPGWLEERFGLFERYCLSSMLAQSEPNFHWILYFDSATPEPFAERARALASLKPGITPFFSDALPMSLIKRSVADLFPQPPAWLLTTRLDNDDGVHADFLATLQKAQSFTHAEVLNCPMGVILSGERAYRRRDDSNAFISLSEPFADFQTVFSIQRHLQARDSYPLRQVASTPLWLQVIHASNISNRVRGWRIPLADAAAGFAPLTPARAAKGESRAAMLAENLSLSLIRTARDVAVRNLRRAAKLFGFDLRRKTAQAPKTVTSPK